MSSGSSKSGGRRNGKSTQKSYIATKVVTQGGRQLDLTHNPLVYGSKANISKEQRKTIGDFESNRKTARVEYAMLVDKDGNMVGMEYKGGKGSVRVPITTYAQADVMSHNHPRGKGQEGILGGTFSNADLKAFSNTGITTMRASAFEGTYSITKGSNFDGNGLAKYYKTLDKKHEAIRHEKALQLNKDYKEKKITYSEYLKQYDKDFNDYLINCHNDLIKGQKQYGYTYSLERNG